MNVSRSFYSQKRRGIDETYEDACIRTLDRNLNFVGQRCELRDKDGHVVASMEGAEHHVYLDSEADTMSAYVEGFVEVEAADDKRDFEPDEPTLYRRELWVAR